MARKQIERPEPDTERKPSAGEGLPRWALVAALVFILLGGVLLATRDAREAGALVDALNAAQLRVSDAADGLANQYGQITVPDRRQEISDALGKCYTNPPLALRIFRQLAEEGTKHGRMMACRMAHCLVTTGAWARRTRRMS